MVKGGLYWHVDTETQVAHIYFHGVSLCGKKMYNGPDRHDMIAEQDPVCAGCIAESRARRDRGLRQGIKGGGNGEKGTD